MDSPRASDLRAEVGVMEDPILITKHAPRLPRVPAELFTWLYDRAVAVGEWPLSVHPEDVVYLGAFMRSEFPEWFKA